MGGGKEEGGGGGGVKWDRIAGVVATEESNKSAKHSGVESRAEQKTEKTQKETQKTEGKAVCMYDVNVDGQRRRGEEEKRRKRALDFLTLEAFVWGGEAQPGRPPKAVSRTPQDFPSPSKALRSFFAVPSASSTSSSIIIIISIRRVYFFIIIFHSTSTH